jgi:hypothetical protein
MPPLHYAVYFFTDDTLYCMCLMATDAATTFVCHATPLTIDDAATSDERCRLITRHAAATILCRHYEPLAAITPAGYAEPLRKAGYRAAA